MQLIGVVSGARTGPDSFSFIFFISGENSQVTVKKQTTTRIGVKLTHLSSDKLDHFSDGHSRRKTVRVHDNVRTQTLQTNSTPHENTSFPCIVNWRSDRCSEAFLNAVYLAPCQAIQ